MNKRRDFDYRLLLAAVLAIFAVVILGNYIDGPSGYFMAIIGLSVGYVIGQVQGARSSNKSKKKKGLTGRIPRFQSPP